MGALMTELVIAGISAQPTRSKPRRMSILLWGPSGSGKTTLACTAPGKKLLLLFDPDGDASISDRDDVTVVDLVGVAAGRVTPLFKSDAKPLGVDGNVLADFDTVIVDSLTNAQHLATLQGIATVKGATAERPSMGAYQTRNALITHLVKNMLAITGRYNKHVIFIAHEASPDRNDDGVVMAITVALGGQLPNTAPVDFSEVWVVEDTGKEHRIAIRPCRMRRPMKTRMFKTTQGAEFNWTHTGTELADWYAAWQANDWQKIAIPK